MVVLLRLMPDPVPIPLWYKSLARLSNDGGYWHEKWHSIRMMELSRADRKCEICGYDGRIVHEAWVYDDSHPVAVQRLGGFKVICYYCNYGIHVGVASVKGKADVAVRQLMRVNCISESEVRKVISEVLERWEYRNGLRWVRDVSWLRERAGYYGLSEKDLDVIVNMVSPQVEFERLVSAFFVGV